MATGEVFDTDILSDEIFDYLCSMCKNQGRITEARKFCVDCHDYFCVSCVQVHSQVPLLVGHKVLDNSQLNQGASKRLPWAPTERCDRHRHKHIDMYCQGHDIVGCSTCMAVDHRLCKDTFYIPEYFQNNVVCNVNPKHIQFRLHSLNATLLKVTDRCRNDKQKLSKRKEELLRKIKTIRQNINDELDKLEKISVEKIEDQLKALEVKIEDELKLLQAKSTIVKSANSRLESKKENKLQAFVNLKLVEQIASNVSKCIEENIININVEDFEFVPDRKINELLHEMEALGKFTIQSQLGEDELKGVGQKKYCVKIQSDDDNFNCNINSACFLEDGTLVLSDCNNWKLKWFDISNNSAISFCQLNGYPGQVCKVTKQGVAVALYLKKEIKIIEQIGMEESLNLKTDFECYGIAHANNQLYIADRNSSVFMYSLKKSRARLLQQFSINQFGHELVYNICGLAVNKDASRIFIADRNNGLLVLNRHGHLVGRYDGPTLKHASGICLTETGYVLVSGYDSCNVVQFTTNGELIGEVLESNKAKCSGGLQGIQTVCCNQTSQMCITRDINNHIELYGI